MSRFEQALQLLRNGSAAAARQAFAALIASGTDSLDTQLGLAYACAADGAPDAALAAVDAALAHDSRELRALLLKADLLQHRGDARAADFYGAALKVAQGFETLPPALLPQLNKARQMLAQHQRALSDQLETDLQHAGAPPTAWTPRFRHSIDLLTGRRERYLPMPTLYCFPDLAPVQFFDREPFPWLPALEAAAPAIRAELQSLLAQRLESFTPYLQSDPQRPMLNTTALLDNRDWGAFHLWKDGSVVAEHAAMCPATMQALAAVPLVHIPGRSPNVLFSRLAPGAHIEAHHGFVNTRLIGHLPLIVPGQCRFRVGNEVREWTEGQAWLFDDTIEHEAWNDSAHERVVLLFEVWRPELSATERAQVTALFAAIARGPGASRNWGI